MMNRLTHLKLLQTISRTLGSAYHVRNSFGGCKVPIFEFFWCHVEIKDQNQDS